MPSADFPVSLWISPLSTCPHAHVSPVVAHVSPRRREAPSTRLLALVGGLVVGGFFLGLGLTAQDGLGEEATVGEVGDVAFADEE